VVSRTSGATEPCVVGAGDGSGRTIGVASGLGLAESVGAGEGVGAGAEVGLAAGRGDGVAVGSARGGMATPARSSAGPAGTGVGDGVGAGSVNVSDCAAKGMAWGAASASGAIRRKAGRRIMAR